MSKNTMFPVDNIYKFTWTSPDGKTYSHIDHILLYRTWYSSALDFRKFREADCDTDRCMVVVKVRERLAGIN
jgi:hypothetical protein